MRELPPFIVALVASATMALAQTPSAVHSFVPGFGQSSGQEPQYYPANVLGLPDTTARRNVPAIDPAQILSLGAGGEIVLRFDIPIVDADGPDFTVFENAFYYTIGPFERIYAEPAQVSVSRDGITYETYPFDSLTLAGCAGTLPTYGDKDPLDPRVSGGNSFDLRQLRIDSVRYIRLRDVVDVIVNNASHPLWDPTLSGFDLDAVVALPPGSRYLAVGDEAMPASARLHLHPNPASSLAKLTLPPGARTVDVLDLQGRLLRQIAVTDGATSIAIEVDHLQPGTYVVQSLSAHGERIATLLRVMR